jgi:hypothetical protein
MAQNDVLNVDSDSNPGMVMLTKWPVHTAESYRLRIRKATFIWPYKTKNSTIQLVGGVDDT